MRVKSNYVRSLPTVLLIVCLLCITTLSLIRQAHPFRLATDDYIYHELAQEISMDVKEALETAGVASAARKLFSAWSLPLPRQANRARPMVFWFWSGAVLMGGQSTLVWVWPVCHIAMLTAIFLFLTRISSLIGAVVLTGALAAAPVTQGLLSWMSCAGYILMSLFAFTGITLLVTFRSRSSTIIGVIFLLAACLSRETGVFLIPASFSLYLLFDRRRMLAASLIILSILVWVFLQAGALPALPSFMGKSSLFIRSTGLVLVGESASFIRNFGLVFLLAILCMVWPFTRLLLPAILLLMLISVHCQLLLLPLLMVCAMRRSREALPGFSWMVVAMGSVALLGLFTGRYAFELLIGVALMLAPVIRRLSRRKQLLLIPFLLWHVSISLRPDDLYRFAPVRQFAFQIDQRFRTLDFVTKLRYKEWKTGAGSTNADWVPVGNMKMTTRDTTGATTKIWRSGSEWRIASPHTLHCLDTPGRFEALFNRERILHWNRWYWIVPPARKPSGIHVNDPEENWAVHTGVANPTHKNCVSIVPGKVKRRRIERREAIRNWLHGIPELNDRRAAERWLTEVWHTEKPCGQILSSPSFCELELGRMLLKDDGWLDRGELTWLRERVRGKHQDH